MAGGKRSPGEVRIAKTMSNPSRSTSGSRISYIVKGLFTDWHWLWKWCQIFQPEGPSFTPLSLRQTNCIPPQIGALPVFSAGQPRIIFNACNKTLRKEPARDIPSTNIKPLKGSVNTSSPVSVLARRDFQAPGQTLTECLAPLLSTLALGQYLLLCGSK